jgi:hypothetical protein
MSIDIRDQQIKSAIAKMQSRAEKQPEENLLFDLYVDCGALDRLQPYKNETISGRRGTGKTHLLRAFNHRVFSNEESVAIHYLDCNSLDSAAANEIDPNALRAHSLSVFNRLLVDIKDYLLNEITRLERPDVNIEQAVFQELAKFDNACTVFMQNAGNRGSSEIKTALERILELLGVKAFVVILDEWVAVNYNIQPFLAEFIKKAFFASARVFFKIAVVDYRSCMSIMEGRTHIGFEKGADIFCDVDLDDYFVYDRDKKHVEDAFAEILFNHIFIASDQKKVEVSAMKAPEKIAFVREAFFASGGAVEELVRAGEGVARDFLQIFSNAYFQHFYLNRGKIKIEMTDIRKGAGDWYQRDKLGAVAANTPLQKALSGIITDVIKGKKARSFMVNQTLGRQPLIDALFDARVLHLVKRGWAHKDDPGERYDIFTIDYGAYVDLINTRSCPQLDLFDIPAEEKLQAVPFDDKRSIRRIVLGEDFLKKYSLN